MSLRLRLRAPPGQAGDGPGPVCDKWLGSDWMSGPFTLTQPEYHTGNTFPSLEKCWGIEKHLFTSRKYWLLPLSEMGYWCLYPDDDVSENRYSDGTQSRWIEGQPFGGQNVISNLQQSQTIQLRRAGLKRWDISIYVSTTKTFICIKYFFLFEPLNFRRVTFMSKIFWKIFHAFFLQGEILFLKISKVIFLSLHFLYSLDLQLRGVKCDNEAWCRQILITRLWSDITMIIIIIIRHHHDPCRF